MKKKHDKKHMEPMEMDHKVHKKLKSRHDKQEAKKHKKKEAKAKKKTKVEKVMHEFGEGKLHSGSKKGPVVKSRKQAIAIGLSEARKAGAKIKKKK